MDDKEKRGFRVVLIQTVHWGGHQFLQKSTSPLVQSAAALA